MREEVKSCNSSLIQTSTRPVEARWLNIVLLAVAVAGWMIFVVACVGGPAWSPDGSKILFGYYDAVNSRDVIALYDRKTHKTRELFSELIPQDELKDDNFILAPAWQANGTRALIAMSTKSDSHDFHCAIVSIPINAGESVRAYNFDKSALCYTSTWLPQIAGVLYLASEGGLTWLDLATGKIDSKAINGDMGFLSEHNGQLVYMREVERPAPTAEKNDATEKGVEVGQIDRKDVVLRPFYSIWEPQTKDLGLTDYLDGAWEPNGTRIAMVGNEADGSRIILLDEKKGILGHFTPNLGAKSVRLGPLVWSHDGQTLYAPVISNGETEKTYVYSLGEIPVGGTPGRLTRIADFHEDELKDDEVENMLELGLQVSLSPDGKTAAASTATLRDAVAEDDRALFLIDLAHKERRITRVHVPENARRH